MPTFSYMARDQYGAVQSGRLDAISEDEVLNILQHRGLLVTSIAQKDLKAPSALPVRRKGPRRMHTGVSVEDQVLLCQQLATLVEAGVPLLKSLEVVCAQVESRMLLIALEEVRRDVQAGRTFRDSLAKHPRIFSHLWLNLVETGETSGHLAQALRQLAKHFEAAQHLQSATKTALTYPAFLVVAAISVLGLFVFWIIPRFEGMFASMEMKMPPITQFVIGMSRGARQYGVGILMLLGLAGYVVGRYLKTDPGKWLMDRLVLRLPLFNTLFTYVQLAEFSRGLATLLESGVPLLSSLEILERSVTNKVYGQAIGHVREAVKEGQTMAEPMSETALFPPMAVQMVLVGEEVGELAKMVSHVAHYYEERVQIFIERMTRLFEPIAIVVMGLLVLFIVLSIFMPIFQMAGGMNIMQDIK